jgi:ubiquinone/menaquinone biosynthesis C-methylase UbiE
MAQDLIKDSVAERYSLSAFENTFYLGYRDIPLLIKKFVRGPLALDYGCGAGRSTRFLKTLGLQVEGVDIDHSMLEEARKLDSQTPYTYIESGQLPFEEASFDLVFSCFVFMTVPKKEELLKIFLHIKRALKPGGVFLFVTSSKYLYIKQYISYNVLPKKSLNSGDEILVGLKDLGVQFTNYFYEDEDYRELLKTVGLELVHFEMPQGHPDEGINWLEEASFSPYAIYTAKK